ncbi:hypothetical protein MMC34_005182 [Xylographa carneopallida]|nr:hypothetical protein [Xylographa carneopallida]
MDLETIRLRAGLDSLSTTPFLNEAAKTSLNHDGGLENQHIHAVYRKDALETRNNVEDVNKKKKEPGLKARAKEKTKSIFHIGGHEDPLDLEDDQTRDRVMSNIDNDPAFHPNQVADEADKQQQKPGSTLDKNLHNLHSVGRAIIHPRKTAASKAHKKTAQELARMERPQLSDVADLEFLDAQGVLDSGSKDTSLNSKSAGLSDWEKAKLLEDHRDSTLVAWTTKHIDRVAAIHKLQIKWPDAEAFIQRDDKGNVARYRWERWLGYNIIFYTQNFSAQYIDDFEELPFDIDQLRDHVERLVMASAPWQKWVMDVRTIYRWENPRRTGIWLAIYTVLWYFQFEIGFAWIYIIYIVLRNRYRPSSIADLQASVRRSQGLEGTALQFGELVAKHGREDWIEPLVDALGPYLQLQLNDLANALEVLAKLRFPSAPKYPLTYTPGFYAWKYPRKTMATLWLFGTCLLVSACADMVFCLKIFWFLAGAAFFLTFPIASHYPKYRLLVSPFKWVFWDVPTNAEWSFAYLRRQAQVVREKMISQHVEEALLEEDLHPALPAYSGHLAFATTTTTRSLTNDSDSASHYGSDSDSDSDSSSTTSFHSTTSHTHTHTHPTSPPSILSFPATHASHRGHLLLSPSHLTFRPTRPSPSRTFTIPLPSLSEIRKLSGPASHLASLTHSSALGTASQAAGAAGEALEFKTRDGREWVVAMGSERDEAFNAVLGFSGLRWQSLQRGPGRGGNGAGSGREVGRGVWGEVGTGGVGG